MHAADFFSAFKEKVSEDKMWEMSRLIDIYRNNGKFTDAVMPLLNELITEAGYIAQNEYFRIDAIGYTTRYKEMKEAALKENIRLSAHLWDLEIAIEHENSKKDWTDEIMKLIHIKCPLKVVIGYSPCNMRGDEEQKKLDFVAKWMPKERAFDIGTGQEKYLVILGNAKAYKVKNRDYDSFGYKAYLYTGPPKNLNR